MLPVQEPFLEELITSLSPWFKQKLIGSEQAEGGGRALQAEGAEGGQGGLGVPSSRYCRQEWSSKDCK